jgi:hypothetical protein
MTYKARHLLEKISSGKASIVNYMRKAPKPVVAAASAGAALLLAPHKGSLAPVKHHEKKAVSKGLLERAAQKARELAVAEQLKPVRVHHRINKRLAQVRAFANAALEKKAVSPEYAALTANSWWKRNMASIPEHAYGLAARARLSSHVDNRIAAFEKNQILNKSPEFVRRYTNVAKQVISGAEKN